MKVKRLSLIRAKEQIVVSICGVLILLAPTVQAGFTSGTELVEEWRSYKITQSWGAEPHRAITIKDVEVGIGASRFMGYVRGVFDMTEVRYGYEGAKTVDQICAVVGKYLEAHPELWGENATTLVIRALKEAFASSNGGR